MEHRIYKIAKDRDTQKSVPFCNGLRRLDQPGRVALISRLAVTVSGNCRTWCHHMPSMH